MVVLSTFNSYVCPVSPSLSTTSFAISWLVGSIIVTASLKSNRLSGGQRQCVQLCSINERNSSNNGVESCGPGEASGWYCTQKIGLVLCLMPSTVWSLRLMRFTATSDGSEEASTAKPWF